MASNTMHDNTEEKETEPSTDANSPHLDDNKEEEISKQQDHSSTSEENVKDSEKGEELAEDQEEGDKQVIIQPTRRIRPGTTTEDITLGFPIDVSESDSWFHQEDRLNQILSTVDPTVLTAEEASMIAVPPPFIEPNLWIYEWLRRLTRDLNLLVVTMLEDGCSPTNCPEMRTLDCQYLCATHDKPRECPATDYIIHTLDYTTALLNSTKLFPNRIMIQDGPVQYLYSSARRLYRIFIHAYEHHNEVFRAFENETGLYTIFLAFAERHGLVPKELITIPSDYKEIMDDQDEYARPPESGTLFEPLTNGEVE